jgi:hypothetical protein
VQGQEDLALIINFKLLLHLCQKAPFGCWYSPLLRYVFNFALYSIPRIHRYTDTHTHTHTPHFLSLDALFQIRHARELGVSAPRAVINVATFIMENELQ